MLLPLRPEDPRRVGSYELVGLLGQGGQGVVYAGRGPGGQVAVKLLNAHFAGDARARERFVRELAIAEKVADFCTARVLAAEVQGDRPYIVSELVDGPSLHELVRVEGPRAGAVLHRLAIGTATALAAIHQARVVHRDFKPSNVLMSGEGPRVIDFGIAKALDGVSTTTGQAGTPPFMAPEQIAAGELGTWTDMFAWGATILFAATGTPPFGTGAAVLYRILHAEPDVSVLEEPLRGLVASCMAKDPHRRPSARHVLLCLVGINAAPDTPGTAEVSGVGVRRGPSRRKVLGLAGGALALVGGGLIATTQLGSKGQGNGKTSTPLADLATAQPLWQRGNVPIVATLIAHPDGVLCLGYESVSGRARNALWNLDSKGSTAWKLPLPDLAVIRSKGAGAGVVHQGTFYFGGSGRPYGGGLKEVPTQIVAVNLARGTQAWSVKLDDPTRYIDSISGIKNGRLYATSTTTEWGPRPVLWAVDITSRRRVWSYETNYEKENDKAAGSSTLIVPPSGDRVFHLASTHGAGQDAQLQTFDAAHSHIAGWKASLPEALGNVSDQPNLCVAGNTLIYASDDLICLDPASGERLWTKEQPAGSYDGFGTPAASADGSLVYITSRTADTNESGKKVITLTLQALEPRSGKERWHSSVAVEIGPEEEFGSVDLLVDDSTVYVLVGKTTTLEYDEDSYRDGTDDVLHPFVWAVDATNGKSRWKYVPPDTFEVAAGFGRLYVATVDGVVALSARGTGI
ncbi:hypothetical protein Misp01_71290 [Microtetraspora sp. NBRC 13810]|uniref:serine/threonine-protein kinase n=1 Tax=Microtetraspora sp. NBRC 13810 TaxID=3030990 RepID=UPI0024A4734E|nr:serine/threonine-protein kinase [Microtetraspora sp. NBRC 13810]GLW12001.1 hypothetical protein Misp01_71290 [Microtetraspora sp. NBRC 13810]